MITSFIPYPIDNGTVIQTDPAITRAGVIDFGKIYRDASQDGPFSAWAFDMTSAFDTSSNFDNQFVAGTGNVPMAVFKFANLTLSGNPTVTLANGGVSNLGLVSVLGITSTPAGDTTFTFSGMHTVLLAAQNGSIQLSGISFLNINTLIMYARGTGSNLSLAAPVFGVTQLRLFAEGDIQVNAPESVNTFRAIAGNDFLTGTGRISARTVFISTQRDINFSSQQFAVGNTTGNTLFLGAARNLNVDISGDQTVFTNAASVDLTGGTINVAGGATNPITLNFGSGVDNINAGAGGLQAPTAIFQHNAFDPANPTLTLNIRSAGDIRVYSIADANIVQASGLINAVDFIGGNTISAGQSITTGGNLVAANSITAGTTIKAGGLLTSPLVTAGGNITADGVEVLTINAPNGILTAGSQGIFPYLLAGPGAQHQFTVNSIVSPNGIDFNGNNYTSTGSAEPQSGGKLNINAITLTFARATGIAFADFSGSDAVTGKVGGSGGTFTTTTSGNTIVNSPIRATTGLMPNNGTFSGAGGTVSLNSTAGAITVNSVIQVSSDDLRGNQVPPPQVRESASGGSITLHSDLTTGPGISVGQSGLLLSLLNRSAPGPGGSILLSTKGADIIVAGQLQADRGTVTISQMDPPGQVPILSIDNGAIITSEILNVASAGDLNIGQTTPVTLNVPTLTLSAPNNVNLSLGSNFISGTSASPANVTVSAGNNLTLSSDPGSAFDLNRSGSGAQDGANLTFTAGAAISVTGSMSAFASANNLQSGANILLSAGSTLSISGVLELSPAAFTGNLASGANLTVRNGTNVAASDITVGSLALSSFNNNGTLGSGGNVALSASRNLTTTTIAPSGNGMFVRNRATITQGGNVSLTVAGNLVSNSSVPLNLSVTNTNGTINTGGNISAFVGGNVSAPQLRLAIFNAGGQIDTGGNIDFTVRGGLSGDTLAAFIDNRGGTITNGGTANVQITGAVSLTGNLRVLGNVNASTITASQLSSTQVTAAPPGSITLGDIVVGSGGITPFAFDDGALFGGMHTITANNLTSKGGINFNGLNLNGTALPTVGNLLTLNVSSFSIALPAGPSANVVGTASFNGGDAPPGTTVGGASGGSFLVNSTGAVTIDSAITATTGLQDQAVVPSGNGGTVDLRSAQGTVTLNAPIIVSSADPPREQLGPPPRRLSNAGGKINLQSSASGTVAAPKVAINVTNTSALLALLDSAATGPGGKITILATGGNSSINVNGQVAVGPAPLTTIAADRGSVDIRHTGATGAINLSNANIRADIVKAAALGANGSLSIGGGTINADTILKLYAVGSNGTINFVANATLSGNSAKTIAANTVNIFNNVVVTINGPTAANVFTNVPNYSGFGGNGTKTGTFGGVGAKPPQPLSAAPPIGEPGGP